MSKSNNNTLYAGIAVVVIVVAAIIVGIVLANKNGGGDTGGEGGSETSQESGEASDFSNVDEVIEFGDYDGMEILSKSIQNGEATGKIVTIGGVVSHPMSNYSVVQESEDGTQKIGTQFIIDGAEEEDYPEDGAQIIITGEIIEKEPLYYVIQTTPEYIRIVDFED